MRRFFWLGIVVAALGIARLAFAVDLGLPESNLSLEAHGFVSQGFIKTTANNYLAQSKRGSSEFTEVGINFTSQPTDRLRLGVQLFARQLGPLGNYNAKADWFYLDYRFRDWLGLRAGRVKLPFGLYNDTSDIDAARVAILLPQSVYSLTSRDFLLAQTGAELYGYLSFRGGGLEYRLYGGTIFFEIPAQYGAALQITSISTPYIVGGRLMWETPIDGLRLGGSVQDLRLDLGLLSAATSTMPATPSTLRLSALLWVTSVEYSAHDLLLAAEYSRWHITSESSNPTLVPLPGAPTVVSERAYAMAAYRVKHWFQPGTYYSVFFPDVDNRSEGSAGVQHDVAATLRFDINTHWLVKLEGHFMRGTAGLQTALNDNTPLGLLTRNWAVFLVKMTAYF
jgi:hypothetical protein